MNVRSNNRRPGSDAEGWVFFRGFIRGWQASRGPARRARGGAAWGGRARRPALSSARILVLVSLCAAVSIAAFAFAAVAAQAVPPVTFAGEGHGEGQVEDPEGVAVDQSSGTVYIADNGNGRVDMFNKEGTFQSAFDEGARPSGVAVDNSADPSRGDVYVVGYRGDVEKFKLNSGTGEYKRVGSSFGQSGPIAIDAEGHVWLGGSERLEEFSSEGVFMKDVSLSMSLLGGSNVEALAIDTDPLSPSYQDFYVIVENLAGVQKLEASGALIETLPGTGDARALGMDPATGDLFVCDQPEPTETSAATLLEYDPSGVETEAFGTGQVLRHPRGNALAYGDQAARLYVVDNAGFEPAAQMFTLAPPGLPEIESSVAEPGKTSATLKASVNPEDHATTYHFQYISEEGYKRDGESFGTGTVTTSQSASIGESFEVVEVSQSITGLSPGVTYRFRIVATNEKGAATGEPAGFATLPPARIDATYSTEVTSSSVTLAGEINPLGTVTSAHFEYLTEVAWRENGESFSGPLAAIVVPVPDAQLGAGDEDVTLTEHLQGLLADTAYRYRVVATNSLTPPAGYAGPTETFTMQGATGTFVLPDGRQWEMVSPADKHGALIKSPVEVDETDEKLIWQAAANGDAMTYEASRPTESGSPGYSWVEQVLSTREPGGGWVSQDISSPSDAPTEGSIGGYPFFSADLSRAVIEPRFSVFLPLSASASEATPYLRDDFALGDVGEHCAENCYTPLVTGCPPQSTPCPPAIEAYADVPPGTSFGERVPTNEEGRGTEHPPEFVGASPDLSYVLLQASAPLTPGAAGDSVYLWSAGKPPSEQLEYVACGGSVALSGAGFVHNATEGVIPPLFTCNAQWPEEHEKAGYNVGATFETEVFDVARPGEPVPLAGELEGIGPEARVFFGDGQECEARVGESGKMECAALSGPGVELAGKSRDGAYVYGYSRAVLSAAPNSQGEKALPGAASLYVTHYANGAWEPPRFVTGAALGPVMVSPNGLWMTFSAGGEAHLYSFERETLVCASCNPTGARKVGGASDPGPEEYRFDQEYYQPRFLSDRGQVFFGTAEALVPKDVNGQTNVYEYEPEGVGSCTSATASGSVVYAPRALGCIGLLSSGESSHGSLFLDASEDGSDVFIYTQDQLVPQDTEGSYSIYDAHECTSAAPCQAPSATLPPPCDTGDSCKPAPMPQPAIFGAPASATFSGAGNVTPAPLPMKTVTKKTVKCKRGFVKNKKKQCVRKKSNKKAKKTNRKVR
jgi:DNA-binding beta-propeller fold protein YncE